MPPRSDRTRRRTATPGRAESRLLLDRRSVFRHRFLLVGPGARGCAFFLGAERFGEQLRRGQRITTSADTLEYDDAARISLRPHFGHGDGTILPGGSAFIRLNSKPRRLRDYGSSTVQPPSPSAPERSRTNTSRNAWLPTISSERSLRSDVDLLRSRPRRGSPVPRSRGDPAPQQHAAQRRARRASIPLEPSVLQRSNAIRRPPGHGEHRAFTPTSPLRDWPGARVHRHHTRRVNRRLRRIGLVHHA